MRQALLFAGCCALFVSVASGCGYGKINAAETARQLHDATTSKRVSCTPGRGDFATWDYECKVYFAHPASVDALGVNVNSTGITFQTAP